EQAQVAKADVEAVAAIIRDEVNVDAIEYIEGAGDLVTRTAKPNFKQLGRKLGKQMKPVAAAVAQLDSDAISAYLDQGEITLTLENDTVTLYEGDLLVSAEGVEGWLVGREDGVTVALDSTITDSLRSRGLAREVVNRVQRLRKQAGFHVADRIRVQYSADADLARAIDAHGAMMARETLAEAYAKQAEPAGDTRQAFDIDGARITLALTRVS